MKICIDPGHYGKYNRSPVVPAYYESEMVWKLHLLLKKELEAFGFEVITTRTEQAKDLSLAARGAMARGCQLFISLHSNACNTESVDRPVGIYFVDDDCGEIDEVSKEIAVLLSNTVRETMSTKNAAKQYSKLSDNDRDDDGKRNDDYYGVLFAAHQAGAAGIILEHSFHTNKRAATWLLDDNNLAKLAKAEAKALADYFGIAAPERAEPKYAVQAGAFSKKAYAQKKAEALEGAGFNDVSVNLGPDNIHRVWVGTFAEKTDAAKRASAVTAAGFSCYVAALNRKKTIDELAWEVIRGLWGNNPERRDRLTAAGYDYPAVQRRVNELLK